MAKITNLTNTYWNIPAGWTATAGYGRFNVEISIDENGEGIGGYERFEVGYTIDADNPDDSIAKANCVTFGPESFWEYNNSKTFQIRFNGGADVTNASLITWLEANGEMEGGEIGSDVVTVKYMDKTIEIATGSSAVLHVAKRLMEEDVTITVPDMGGEEVPEWDGSYTISGGTISFTIDGVSYEAEEGMTWYDWVSSSYNTGGFKLVDEAVYTADDYAVVSNSAEVIENNGEYAKSNSRD